MLDANDLVSLRRAIETHQETLLDEQVIAALQAAAAQAQQAGQDEAAQAFGSLASLLAACREHGIAATFDRLSG